MTRRRGDGNLYRKLKLKRGRDSATDETREAITLCICFLSHVPVFFQYLLHTDKGNIRERRHERIRDIRKKTERRGKTELVGKRGARKVNRERKRIMQVRRRKETDEW